MDFRDGTLTLEGDVVSVAAKKLALEHAAAVAEVDGIIDRLRVVPASPMGDGEIRDLVRDALVQEPALRDCALYLGTGDTRETLRVPAKGAHGEIALTVDAGVVTLTGEVPGLALKRLVGVLAWWVPGSRDVINGIAVEPPEADSEAGLTDAVRMALEKDPFVDAAQVRVRSQGAVVLLQGLVPTPSEREMAEFDAWYVFGVDKVVNRIEVRP
jgi:osmotically-inducible protein OsmY